MIETAVFTSVEGGGTRWRLMGVEDDIARSRHHVRLNFDVAGGQLVGSIVLWGSDEEVALDDVVFNGTALSFRLPAVVAGKRVVAPGFDRSPRCALTLLGDREFRGYYVDEQDRRLDAAPELKLVRVQEDAMSL